jgi:hypothetical protein
MQRNGRIVYLDQLLAEENLLLQAVLDEAAMQDQLVRALQAEGLLVEARDLARVLGLLLRRAAQGLSK